MRSLERTLLHALRRIVPRSNIGILQNIYKKCTHPSSVHVPLFRQFSSEGMPSSPPPPISHKISNTAHPKGRSFPPGRQISLFFGLLLAGFGTVVVRDIMRSLIDEFDEAQDWRGSDNEDGQFGSVTVGSDDHQFSSLSNDISEKPLLQRLPILLYRRLERGVRLLFRQTVLTVRFVPLLVSLGVIIGLASVRGEMDIFALETERSMTSWYKAWWERFAAALESSGPAFIKLGQYLSSRPDLFSNSVCAILASLRDSTSPHSWEDTEEILREALGEQWHTKLSIPNETPIGSGCIAQVYRGLYTDVHGDSVDVAVKVQHPTALPQIVTDLQLIHLVARIIDALPFSPFEAISFQSLSIEFARQMHSQLDLTQEARNQNRFLRNFQRPANQTMNAQFPCPIESKQNVLIETFHTGVPAALLMGGIPDRALTPNELIFTALPAESQQQLKKDVAECGLDAFLHMQFAHGFFHADLHPGNMMFDFGFSPAQEQALAAYIKAHGKLPPVNEHEDISHDEDVYLRELIPDTFLAIHADDIRVHKFARTPAALYRAIGLPVPAREPKLVMIDAGMATALTERDQNNFNDLFFNIASGDGYTAAGLMIERARPVQKDPNEMKKHEAICIRQHRYNDHGACLCGLYGPREEHLLNNMETITLETLPRAPKQSAADRRQFIEDVGALANAAQKQSFKLNGMGVVSTLQTLAACARENSIALDCAFVSVVIAVTVMEGFGRALDPYCDVLGPALKIVTKCSVREAKRKMEQ